MSTPISKNSDLSILSDLRIALAGAILSTWIGKKPPAVESHCRHHGSTATNELQTCHTW